MPTDNRPFVDAHRVLPMLGQRYEFDRMGERWTGRVTLVQRGPGGRIYVETEDQRRVVHTALNLGYRPEKAAA